VLPPAASAGEDLLEDLLSVMPDSSAELTVMPWRREGALPMFCPHYPTSLPCWRRYGRRAK